MQREQMTESHLEWPSPKKIQNAQNQIKSLIGCGQKWPGLFQLLVLTCIAGWPAASALTAPCTNSAYAAICMNHTAPPWASQVAFSSLDPYAHGAPAPAVLACLHASGADVGPTTNLGHSALMAHAVPEQLFHGELTHRACDAEVAWTARTRWNLSLFSLSFREYGFLFHFWIPVLFLWDLSTLTKFLSRLIKRRNEPLHDVSFETNFETTKQKQKRKNKWSRLRLKPAVLIKRKGRWRRRKTQSAPSDRPARPFKLIWAARVVGKKRVPGARVRSRRLAQQLHMRARAYRSGLVRRHVPHFGTALKIWKPLSPSQGPPDSYDTWIHDISDSLRGGAAGSARTGRKRKAKQNKQTALQNDLTRTLIQGLKTCLNKGASQHDLLQMLQNFVEPSVPVPRKRPKRKPPAQHVDEHVEVHARGEKDGQIEKRFWTDSRGSRPYWIDQKSGWWWWSDPRGKEKHSFDLHSCWTPPVQSLPKKPSVSRPKITQLTAADWNQPLCFASLQSVTQSIKTGTPWTTNVVVSDSLHEVVTLKDLFDGFSVSQGLTVVLTGEAKNLPGAFHTRLRVKRTGKTDKLEEVSLFALGSRSPWILPPQQVEPSAVKTVDRVGLRILVPGHYRASFKPCPEKEQVTDILAELARWGPKVHHLTGGRWKWEQQSRDTAWQLCGWISAPAEEAKSLLNSSGKRGIFVNAHQSVSDPSTRPEFVWFPKNKDETRDQYLQRALNLANTRKQPLRIRKGFGSDLGVEQKPEDERISKFKHLELTGVPRLWKAEEIEQLLTSQKWCDVQVGNPRKVQRQVVWYIRAKPPPNCPSQTSWRYQCADNYDILLNEKVRNVRQPWTSNDVKAPARIGPITLRLPRCTKCLMGTAAVRSAKLKLRMQPVAIGVEVRMLKYLPLLLMSKPKMNPTPWTLLRRSRPISWRPLNKAGLSKTTWVPETAVGEL